MVDHARDMFNIMRKRQSQNDLNSGEAVRTVHLG